MDDRRISLEDRQADGHPASGSAVEREPRFTGLRMTAEEYETLPDDGFRYELIDGVVVMSPSPNFGHQDIASEIEWQIRGYLKKRPIGRTGRETDVVFDPIRVYRPDLVFLSKERVPDPKDHIRAVPEMVLEVLSAGTKERDLLTKRQDYERFGVTEYWIVDPATAKFTFLRLAMVRGKFAYQSVAAKGSKFSSKAIPGFTLDIAAVKRVMRS